MNKSDDIERTPRLPATRLALCSLFLVIGCLIGTQILVPFGSLGNHFHSSTYSDLQILPQSGLEKTPKENAEELLIETLVLFQDLLNQISGGDGSNELHRKRSSKKIARGIASDFSSLLNNFSAGDPPGMVATADKGIADSFSSFIGKLGFGNITGSLSAGAADASKYLGIGLGNGTITGLELPAQYLKLSKVAMEKPSGLNLIASNLGQGLTSSLIGSIDTKSITPDPGMLSLAAKALGEGAGNGASVGLNLKPMSAIVYSNDTGIPAIAGNLAQGLTSSFLSGVDVKSLAMSSMTSVSGDQINAAAKALAQGLGSGAASATKLNPNPPSSDAFDQNGISGIAGNLGQGLSTSFLEGIPFQQLLTNNAPSISPDQISDAAKGLGAGLAGGAVIGLGLQPDSGGSNVPLAPGGLGTMTESFGRGLTQSFLTNGTVTKLLATMQQPNQLDVGSVAKGLAIGLVDGATTGFDNAGGAKNIFNLDSGSTPEVTRLTKPTTYDDTVGGAATGFGTGLGLQSTTFVLQLFGKPPIYQGSDNPNMITSGTPDSKKALADPPAANSSNLQPSRGVIASGVRRRQETTIGSPISSEPSMFNSSDLLNLPQFNGTISPVVQKAIDTLQCQGIGGLVTVLFSVGSSQGVNPSSVDVNDLKEKIGRLGFAKQTIEIQDKESGNQYMVNIAQFDVKVNGNSLVKTIVVLVLHILLAIVAFGVVIPVILIINSIRNLAVMNGRADVLKNSRRIQWILALVVLLPSTLIVLITGIISEGVKSHFTSIHGITGLLLSLFTLPIFPLAYLYLRNKAKTLFNINLGLILTLLMSVLITGFIDLSSLALCATQIIPQTVFISIGSFLSTPLIFSNAFLVLEILMGRWRGKTNDQRQSEMFLNGKSAMKDEERIGLKQPTMTITERNIGEKNFMDT
ncbi:hypothetical protein EV44_g4736 [Erysiphe necator]|uniref:Uncharacterized protein n=1 Tax=Uncinula necator TaxID=52586 RepID=A0A0B1NW96_UNCNE|nr:hypothetical protein EV44_g4736 [Erysiphe necator]